MADFKIGKTYVLKPVKGAEGLKKEKRLTYIGSFPAATPLEVFRCASAKWLETFTREQLRDYRADHA